MNEVLCLSHIGVASEVTRRVARDQWLYIPSKGCSVSSLMWIHLQANTYSLRRIELSKLQGNEILSRISSYRSVLFTWLSDKNLLCYSAAGLAAPATVFPVPPASGPSLHLTSVSPLPPALHGTRVHS